tara:strand:- start:2021 stop:2740 length:720 start_codon:yes stop_codon:yes gene_type:complete
MSKENKDHQLDLFGFDPKEKELKLEEIKKIKNIEKNKELRAKQRVVEEDELREWELLKYIKDNYKKIIIPEMEVIEHKQSSKGIHKSNKGFINFVIPYPIFPHKDDDELELAKEALIWFQENFNLWLNPPPEFVATFFSYLGGIREKDAYTPYGKVIEDVGWIDKSNESKYFTNLYMFDSEGSCYLDHYYDDMDYQFTETGFHFEWEYPEYFQIIESDFDKFAKRLWDELLEVSEVWYA